jgi:flagellar biosynthesis protein FlhF
VQIKRYEAANTQEAMGKIKNDLGPDAIVLSTKKLRGGRSPLYEVMAAKDDYSEEAGNPSFLSGAGALGESGREEILSAFRKETGEIKRLISQMGGRNDFYGELDEIKESLNAFFDVLGIKKKDTGKDPLSRVYASLVSSGVARYRAYAAVNALKKRIPPEGSKDYEEILKAAEDFMVQSIAPNYRRGSESRVVAFVGPTGVGKTTTLAKLAAHHAVERKKRIGLVTADTYRIAAAEQLKTYARILGVPVEIATDRDQFKRVLHKFADKDLILVDTPGKSRRDGAYMEKLKDFFTVDTPVETNLLISMSTSRQCIMDTTERFEPVHYNSIIFTKFDECDHAGLIYNVIDQVRKPVSYVTNGQDVPQDIEKIDPVKLARMILRRKMH